MTEAELLLSHRFATDRAGLCRKRNDLLSQEDRLFISSVLKRRMRGEPVQYILGKADFFGLEFHVSPSVLIPRPETELLVEEAIALSACCGKAPRILEIGTGSGCIAASLGRAIPGARITAVDVSGQALQVAAGNLRLHAVQARLIQSDCTSALGRDEQFDIIISNPPYIKRGQIQSLQPEIQYEPVGALDGGPDGLDFYRRIADECKNFISGAGAIVLEIGHDQRAGIEEIFRDDAGYEVIRFVKDYNGKDRIAVIKKSEG